MKNKEKLSVLLLNKFFCMFFILCLTWLTNRDLQKGQHATGENMKDRFVSGRFKV